MSTLTDQMFILLRSSLNQRPADLTPLSEDDWKKLFWLARQHGIVTIINDANNENKTIVFHMRNGSTITVPLEEAQRRK